MPVPTSVLARPRHPIVEDALQLARQWCAGHVIDNAPALAHAVRVAVVLGRYLPAPPPELVAAALLHDAPEYAPAGVDLDLLLTARLGPAATRVVRGMQGEHDALAGRAATALSTADRWTLYASAADKIVSLRSILGRAERAADPADYWATRAAFLDRVGYFRTFHTATSAQLPEPMSTSLARLVTTAEDAAATFTGIAARPVPAVTAAGRTRPNPDRPTADGARVLSMAAYLGRRS